MKPKYTCGNCGAAQGRKHIEAMRKAGFALHHLGCRECGQQTVTEPQRGAAK
jgi:hypothetical protein